MTEQTQNTQMQLMQQILQKIEQYDKIVISRHMRPDGDAIGSTKGLKEIIKLTWPNKDVRLINSDGSDYLAFWEERTNRRRMNFTARRCA